MPRLRRPRRTLLRWSKRRSTRWCLHRCYRTGLRRPWQCRLLWLRQRSLFRTWQSCLRQWCRLFWLWRQRLLWPRGTTQWRPQRSYIQPRRGDIRWHQRWRQLWRACLSRPWQCRCQPWRSYALLHGPRWRLLPRTRRTWISWSRRQHGRHCAKLPLRPPGACRLAGGAHALLAAWVPGQLRRPG